MKKNVWFLGLLACALALGTLLAGCETPTNAGKDKWLPVTSLSQLDGTWEFSYSETQTLAEWAEDFEGILGEELPPEAQIYLSMMSIMMSTMMSGVEVTMKVEGILTIDADEQTVEGAGTATVAFSGDGSELIKIYIGLLMREMPDNAVFDPLKNSITMPYDFGPEPINDDKIADVPATMEISQDGKKIKISEPGLGSREIIATKQ